MTKTINVTTEIPPNREVTITLPNDFPVGPVRLMVTATTSAEETAPSHTLGDLLNSEFFGVWRERTDIADSVDFAERLRIEGWRRGL